MCFVCLFVCILVVFFFLRRGGWDAAKMKGGYGETGVHDEIPQESINKCVRRYFKI